MRASLSKWRGLAGWEGRFVLALWASGAIAAPTLAGPGDSPTPARISEGLRLFLTDWSTTGRDESKGDGIGPVFNERSCVACHSQGGPGGAGGSREDVLILTDAGSARLPDGSIDSTAEDARKPGRPRSSGVFPGFAAERSLVLHRFSSDPGYELWRSSVLRSFGVPARRGPGSPGSEFSVRASYRNTPALFGAGWIDAIPEAVLEAASLRPIPDFPEVRGRVGRLKDGRTGRFGWKAQTASLGDFVRTACANELGLENPGHSQSPDPLRPNYKAPGLDLTDAECASLTAFVAALPRPVEPSRPSLLRADQLANGRQAFVAIGCAACHMPKLGEVEGIYSDLLLHDMGRDLSDSGEYYGAPTSPGLAVAPPKGAEWRTPPLWGLRDSAPYLHDGRAANLGVAVALHGGEAELSARRFKKLDQESRKGLNMFLLSLTAPPRADADRKSRSR